MPFCNNCGTQYSIGDKKCTKCNMVFLSVSDVPPNAVMKELTNPIVKRLLAGAIDLSLVIIIFFLLFFSRRAIIAVLLRKSAAIAIPHLYLLLKDSLEGKSLGKLLMGILAYNEKDKKAANMLDSIIRNWYLAIPFIGPTVFAFIIGVQILSGKKKRLGDEGAGTIVISDSDFLRIK